MCPRNVNQVHNVMQVRCFPSFQSDVPCTGGAQLIRSHSLARFYRSGTVNSKSFVGKVLLRIKWKFELTVYFKHEMLGKL